MFSATDIKRGKILTVFEGDGSIEIGKEDELGVTLHSG